MNPVFRCPVFGGLRAVITFILVICLEMEGSLHDGHDLVLDGSHVLGAHELDDVSLDWKKTG